MKKINFYVLNTYKMDKFEENYEQSEMMENSSVPFPIDINDQKLAKDQLENYEKSLDVLSSGELGEIQESMVNYIDSSEETLLLLNEVHGALDEYISTTKKSLGNGFEDAMGGIKKSDFKALKSNLALAKMIIGRAKEIESEDSESLKQLKGINTSLSEN